MTALARAVQRARLEAVGDHLDLGFVESLLPRNCEADVPSVAAVGDARVPQARDLLGGVVDLAVTPQQAVQHEEPLQRLRLERERAVGDRVVGHQALGLAAVRSPRIVRKRVKPSNTASASTSATSPASPTCVTTASRISARHAVGIDHELLGEREACGEGTRRVVGRDRVGRRALGPQQLRAPRPARVQDRGVDAARGSRTPTRSRGTRRRGRAGARTRRRTPTRRRPRPRATTCSRHHHRFASVDRPDRLTGKRFDARHRPMKLPPSQTMVWPVT